MTRTWQGFCGIDLGAACPHRCRSDLRDTTVSGRELSEVMHSALFGHGSMTFQLLGVQEAADGASKG